MRNALIYSSSFKGHRQVYVFVISHVLQELGYAIIIAGNFNETASKFFYLDKLRNDSGISFIDSGGYSTGRGKISLDELAGLQKKYSPSLTVFPDADHHLALFTGRVLNRNITLNGRLIGIFIRPFYIYERLSIKGFIKYIISLRKCWRNDARLFHGFFQRYFHVLDRSFCIDEKFTSQNRKVIWLPDVFQKFADTLIREDSVNQRHWIEKLRAFKAKNKGRFVILYFGTAQYRRGYDLLLKLAVKSDACFIHCGLNSKSETYDLPVDEYKMRLYSEDRILETNEFISDPECVKAFFQSTSHLILPYRDFPGSSGVMLQALDYGIPVLVPENGLMGYRVKKHNLGQTYPSSYESLERNYYEFVQKPHSRFQESIEKYMKTQSVEYLERTLLEMFQDHAVQS